MILEDVPKTLEQDELNRMKKFIITQMKETCKMSIREIAWSLRISQRVVREYLK